MKTIKQIADELGVSKTAVRKKIAELNIQQSLKYEKNRVLINAAQERKIKNAFVNYNPVFDKIILSGNNDNSSDIDINTDIVESDKNDCIAERKSHNNSVDYAKLMIDILKQQLAEKDRQIAEYDKQIHELHECLHNLNLILGEQMKFQIQSTDSMRFD